MQGALFVVLGFLVALYVVQVTTEVSGRYVVQEGEQRLAALQEQYQHTEMVAAESHALDGIVLAAAALNFEKTTTIQYIHVIGNEVVQK